RPVGGVIMNRKPARGIHQVRAFGADVSQSLGRERATLRRNECAAPANSQCYRLVCGNYAAEVDADARAERADSDCVLNVARQGLPGHLDAFDFQRAVELENDRTRGILWHK